MIFVGYDDPEKIAEIARYCAENDIHKTVVISADEFPLPVPGTDQVKYSDVIMYVTFYRLLQEIGPQTLIVLNECLRTQNRYDLSYNCIRNYLNQTQHQLIFQQLPQIDAQEDFMILFDFDTRSRWKRQKFDAELVLDNARVSIKQLPVGFTRIDVPTSAATKRRYARERKRLFDGLGTKDPHTLPRNLHLISGKDKLAWINSQSWLNLPLFGGTMPERRYVARNKRLKHDNIVTYREVQAGTQYAMVDLPHRFIDFCDFVRRTGQAGGEVLVADLRVDKWYYRRYYDWSERINGTYASLQQP